MTFPYFNQVLKFFSILIMCIVVLADLACSGDTPPEQAPASNKEMNEQITPPKKDQRKKIVFFGNSLTAAYGLNPSQGFVALIQEKIDARQLDYRVVNAGLSGETTAGGKERIDWILKQPMDLFILELGGNDGLRGINPTASKSNLEAIIQKVKKANPSIKIVLAGMKAPPNMGEEFTMAFRKMYPDLAKAYQLAFIPFLLENVGGIAELNQLDGIHPNARGNEIIAETIWKTLEPLL